jgi:hypothetical protein
LLEGWVKTESEGIGAVCAPPMTDVKDGLAEHVRMVAQYLTVEPDGDKCVYSLED